ncbi:MAG: hypothetical protein Ta2B_20290 [Termitinemataceae bacterium]|nr:MAG: hypothetical protein Ta2B_20290 [Termitinemataceae bacterium]
MKKVVIYVLILCCCCAASFAQSAYNEKDGGFSVSVLDGWKLTEMEGVKYKVIYKNPENNFAPNIIFTEEVANIKITDYVDESVLQFSDMFENAELISRKDFKTKSGLKGERVIVNYTQNNVEVRQTFYFLPLKQNRKMIIICSVLQSTGDKFDADFDGTVKSFKAK